MYSAKENINILTSLLRGYGVRHVVVCPGSRNAAIVHNFNECQDFICHPVTDERSAGFVALGLTSALSVDAHVEPVAVCVTSGTALLNTLPAVAEATYQHRGIIVVSADRPEAWIDQLDGQTLSQPNALGKFVAKSVSLPEPTDYTQRWCCRRLICEAMLTWSAASHPSVHINVPITEPLFDFSTPELPKLRIVSLVDNTDELVDGLLKAKRPMVVVGQLMFSNVIADCLNKIKQHFVVLAEQLSSACPISVDQMLYSIGKDNKAYLPDFIVYLGGHTVSKRLRQFLRLVDESTDVWMVNENGEIEDVTMHATSVLMCKPETALSVLSENIKSLPLSDYYNLWGNLEKEVSQSHEQFNPAYSQMLAVKLFEENFDAQCSENVKSLVFYANSMSIRLAALYARHYVYCNRGVNGIEGSLSVAAGASLADKSRMTFCIIGDLSFFYDQNALWNTELSGNFRVLLLNNHCGAIFKNLKGLENSPSRDEYVSASHQLTAKGICLQNVVDYRRVTDEQGLIENMVWLFETSESIRPRLLEVMTDPERDTEVYKEYYHSL